MQNYKDQCVPPTSSPIYHPKNIPELQEDLVPSPKPVLSTSYAPGTVMRKETSEGMNTCLAISDSCPVGKSDCFRQYGKDCAGGEEGRGKAGGDKERRHTVMFYEL